MDTFVTETISILANAPMLFVVGFILLLIVVEPDQRKAIAKLEHGDDADVHRGRIVAVSSTVALFWLVVLVLIVWHPGAVR